MQDDRNPFLGQGTQPALQATTPEEQPETPHYEAVDTRTSGLAIASLICGILSLPIMFCLSVVGIPVALAAVVCGHMARAQAKASHGACGGSGMAFAGLILGYTCLLLALAWILLFILVIGKNGFPPDQP